jgi:hypothetical protein
VINFDQTRLSASNRLETTPLTQLSACEPGGACLREIAMTFDMEEDFENERWRLLALVDRRNNLSDTSEGAIKTDLEIVATRELLRTYETLKGFWSRKDRHNGYKDARWGPSLVGIKPSQRSGSTNTSAE